MSHARWNFGECNAPPPLVEGMRPLVKFHQAPEGLRIQPGQALEHHQLDRLVSNLVQRQRQVMMVDDERPVVGTEDGRKAVLSEHGFSGAVGEPFPLGALVLYFDKSNTALRRGEIA